VGSTGRSFFSRLLLLVLFARVDFCMDLSFWNWFEEGGREKEVDASTRTKRVRLVERGFRECKHAKGEIEDCIRLNI